MEETKIEAEPAIRENTGRNVDGTFQKGFSGNPLGRPKGTMKDYLRKKFMDMEDSEKEEFLKGVSPEMQIKLAEGNPANATDLTSGGRPIVLSEEVIDKNAIAPSPERNS